MNSFHFEKIEAWQLARKLTDQVYQLVSRGVFSRDFGLRDQITRAACSAMHNTAEGFDAESTTEFIRFLRYAKGSRTEVQSELYIALDQSYISQAQFDETYELARHTRAEIGAFINYLKTYQARQT
ncbi:MAG: four helix bundle protein [Verrucomicrobiota bacterium]